MAVGMDLSGYGFAVREKEGVGRCLVPSDVHAEEYLKEIKLNREILVEARTVRSPLQHRWFFAMLRKVIDATGSWPSPEALLDATKIAVGHTRLVIPFGGTEEDVQTIPKSISFGSMDQTAFQRFVRRSVWVIGQHTGIDPEQIMKETDASFSEPGWFKRQFGRYMAPKGANP